MLGALALRFRDAWLINNTMVNVIVLVSGANVPRHVLPGWMRTVGDLTPVTHATAAARSLVNGASLSAASGNLLRELAVGAAYAVIAAILLKLFETESRRRASLDTL